MSPQKDRIRLTDAVLAGLLCPEGRKDVLHFDAVEPGFGVRVTADGKRIYIFQYRVGATVRRHRIGVWGVGGLSSAKARKEAERLRGLVHGGRDPVAERTAAQAGTLAAARVAREQAAIDAFTFGKLIESWETKGVAHRRESYVSDATARLRAYFAAWSDRPAAGITKSEVIQALDRVELERGTTSARRALSYARAAYGWAVKRDVVEINPFQGVAAPGKENPRDRVLTDAEIGAVWKAAGALAATQEVFVRLLLLTLQRRDEVAGMRWDELASDLTTWTIPAGRTKNGKAHLVHLAPTVRDIIRGIPWRAGTPLVLVGRRKGQIGGFSRIKEDLAAAMIVGSVSPVPGAARKKKGQAGPDWRFHDFRRTGVTAIATLGIPPHVADKLLNHVTGAIQGVAAVYQRAEFLSERKHAIEAWATHVLACAGAQVGGNVVTLDRRTVGRDG